MCHNGDARKRRRKEANNCHCFSNYTTSFKLYNPSKSNSCIQLFCGQNINQIPSSLSSAELLHPVSWSEQQRTHTRVFAFNYDQHILGLNGRFQKH